MACICVNWSADAVVATSEERPTGMPCFSATCPGAQPCPICSSTCGATDTLPPDEATMSHSSSSRWHEWMYVVFG